MIQFIDMPIRRYKDLGRAFNVPGIDALESKFIMELTYRTPFLIRLRRIRTMANTQSEHLHNPVPAWCECRDGVRVEIISPRDKDLSYIKCERTFWYPFRSGHLVDTALDLFQEASDDLSIYGNPDASPPAGQIHV